MRRVSNQSHSMRNFVQFLAARLLQLFPLRRELLIDLHRFLRHHLVSFLAPPDQGEILSCSDTLVPVRIQSNSQHDCFLLSALRHYIEPKRPSEACKLKYTRALDNSQRPIKNRQTDDLAPRYMRPVQLSLRRKEKRP